MDLLTRGHPAFPRILRMPPSSLEPKPRARQRCCWYPFYQYPALDGDIAIGRAVIRTTTLCPFCQADPHMHCEPLLCDVLQVYLR